MGRDKNQNKSARETSIDRRGDASKGGHSHNYQHDHQSDSGRDGPLIDTSDDVQMEGSTSHDPNYQVSQGETGYAQGDEHQRSEYSSNEPQGQEYNIGDTRSIGDHAHINLNRDYSTNVPEEFPQYAHPEELSAYAQADQEQHQPSHQPQMSRNFNREKERPNGRPNSLNPHGKRPLPPRPDQGAKIQQLEEQLNNYATEIARLRSINQEQHGWLQNEHQTRLRLENENANLHKVQKEQQSQVRMAQELMLKDTKKGSGGLADEDRTIRHNFKKLQTDIRDWGRLWACKSILKVEKLEESDGRSEAMAFLAQVVRVDDDHLPKGLTSAKMAPKAPAMCLSALLYHEVCMSVLEKPFGHLRYGAPEDVMAETLAKEDGTLDKVYSELSKYDEQKTQAWRSLMLEIFDPSTGKGELAYLARDHAIRRRLKLSNDLTSRLLSSPGRVLLKPVSPEEEAKRREELLNIFQSALELSARLWKQPIVLRTKRFADLLEDTFSVDSEFMDAHPLHQLEDEKRLDNHRIILVVSPAILGMGDSDGGNYLQHRVWGKAVVLLEE